MSDPRPELAALARPRLLEQWTDDEINALITPERTIGCPHCSKSFRFRQFDVKAWATILDQLWGKPADPPQKVQIDTTVRHIHQLSDEQLAAIADGRADVDGVAWEDEPPGLPPAA